MKLMNNQEVYIHNDKDFDLIEVQPKLELVSATKETSFEAISRIYSKLTLIEEIIKRKKKVA